MAIGVEDLASFGAFCSSARLLGHNFNPSFEHPKTISDTVLFVAFSWDRWDSSTRNRGTDGTDWRGQRGQTVMLKRRRRGRKPRIRIGWSPSLNPDIPRNSGE
eukprot:scaffold2473_cov247-Pinguiococcus_pyrenoidosus.AAC.20